MTNEEIAVTLAEHEQDISYLKTQTENINKLVTSVEILANNMERMAKEQEKQGSRLEKLEQKPTKDYEQLKRTIITSICTAIVGAIIGAILGIII